MLNIEYLTERDLKYFEKKEALGEAIIIRIEPEILLSMNLDELFPDRKKDQTLSAEELKEFLQIDQKEPLRQEEAEVSSKEITLTGIEKKLQNIRLPADQRQALMQLISSGASDEELMEIIGAREDQIDNQETAADAYNSEETGG